MLSVHESTWSKEKKMHTCCGSMHSYHKTSCPVRRSLPQIPGRASDPLFVRVHELKNEGLTSGQIAHEMGLPLDQVNELFVQ